MSQVHVRFFILILLLGCNRPDIPVCTTEGNTLHGNFPFPLGIAVDLGELESNGMYTQLVSGQFNSITPENIFKPSYLQPEPGEFFWEDADRLVVYCQENNMRLHGHTLIWHNQLPYWMETFQGDAAAWDSLMKSHIQTIVEHFAGQVEGWDVVNEAFEDDGSLRDNIWLQHIGESYIEKAFAYAHAADPEAKLFYNDYNLSAKDRKRNAILEWCNKVRDQGIRIDGIGTQMHIAHNYPSKRAISQALSDLAENEYLIHISELDVSINLLGRTMDSPSDNRLRKQAERYQFVFESYQELPVAYQYGLSIWGLSDRDSWIPGFFSRDDFPLLFDENYEAKPAYCGLMEL